MAAERIANCPDINVMIQNARELGINIPQSALDTQQMLAVKADKPESRAKRVDQEVRDLTFDSTAILKRIIPMALCRHHDREVL